MAKSKNSKILAMALCASVMAGIYATPVMAADLSVALDNQGIYALENAWDLTDNTHDVYGTLTISETQLTTALSGTDLTLNAITANTISTTGDAFTVDTNGDVIAKSVTTSGDVTAGTYSLKSIGANTAGIIRKDVDENGKGMTEIENTLVVNGKTGVISNYGGQFTLDASGNVRTTGDIVSSDKNHNYSLNAIGANTQHITHNENGTHIEGMTIAKGDPGANLSGIYTINGASFVPTNRNGGITISGVTLEQGGYKCLF